MNVRLTVGALLAASTLLVQTGLESAARAPQTRAPQPASAAAEGRALLDSYCLGCHRGEQKARGLVPIALDGLNLSNVAANAREWEAVVRKMRAGLMPPAGMPRPDRDRHDAFVARLEAELDRAAQASPNPGRTEAFHRLNRTEYRNAVRDLLGLDIDVSSMLPADDASYGFDNIAGVLKLSPTLMERYLVAAQKISRAAVGTPPPFPAVDYFRVADDLSQEDRLPGQSLGTRGGTTIRYTFPMDAQYTIRVELSRDLNEQVPIYAEAHDLEVSIDGERVQVFTLPGIGGPPPPPAAEPGADPPPDANDNAGAAPPAPPRAGARTAQPPRAQRVSRQGQEQRNRADREWEIKVPVKAGTRDVQVAFLKNGSALAETARLPFLRPYPAGVNIAEQRGGAYLRSVEISGPFDPDGPGTSPSRQRILTCVPDGESRETACARSIFRTLARRAFRRPVTDADLEPLMALYREGRRDGSFDRGIEQGVMRLLVAPEFLFRIETEPANIARDRAYRISELELASRLSFFLWSSIPDDELLDLAERGQLSTPAVLDRQVTRMIADPRFSAFVEGFAGQWLFLRNLAAAVPVQQNFPDFDDTLRQAFRRETELFFESIVREGRSAYDLLRADYTFVNERLARHYGIPNVKGTRFRRVTLGGATHRAGLLGQGSILTVTSYPDRTSPVVRGKWVLENLLGSPPPPPLPNVPELEKPSFAAAPRSVRERIAQHRRSPTCSSCHSMMDPIGLALENFDAVGRYRTFEESGAPIDASGALPDGTKFVGARGLTEALLRSDMFVRTLSEKMMTYALGRGLEYYDAPAVRAIVRGAARQDYRVDSLIREIVRSAPFQMRRAAQER
jgi:mono/diheme cytochrome c family protein